MLVKNAASGQRLHLYVGLRPVTVSPKWCFEKIRLVAESMRFSIAK